MAEGGQLRLVGDVRRLHSHLPHYVRVLYLVRVRVGQRIVAAFLVQLRVVPVGVQLSDRGVLGHLGQLVVVGALLLTLALLLLRHKFLIHDGVLLYLLLFALVVLLLCLLLVLLLGKLHTEHALELLLLALLLLEALLEIQFLLLLLAEHLLFNEERLLL